MAEQTVRVQLMITPELEQGIEEIIPILAEREGCSQREITKRRIHEDALRLYIKVIKGGKI